MEFFWLAVGILGVWRLTHLLNAEDGPWNVVAHLRRRLGTGFWFSLLDCFYCLSLWVAAPFALFLGDGMKMKLFLWPALSAGAILLERSTTRTEAAPAPYWKEEDPDVMLREEQIGRDPGDSAGGYPVRDAPALRTFGSKRLAPDELRIRGRSRSHRDRARDRISAPVRWARSAAVGRPTRPGVACGRAGAA